jgi:hypothetical protein
MRPMDIYNFSAYKKYMEENSTDVYGELWLTGKDHAQSNNFVESRHSVEKRSFRLLEKYSNFLKKKSLNGKVPTCILLFNHFEIGTPILKGLYTEKNIFPSAKLKYSCGELKNLPDVFPQDYAEPICIIPGQGLYFYKIVAPFRQLNRNVYALEKERRFMQLS